MAYVMPIRASVPLSYKRFILQSEFRISSIGAAIYWPYILLIYLRAMQLV
jgi:hypothetical protein